jgi:hypothetical protein
MGTMMFGQEGYHETQKDVCTCVETGSMKDHYTALVESFYSIHAPEKLDGAQEAMDKFLAKHTTVPGAQPAYPFSKLYYALHKKYGDSAIVRTKKGKTREEL